MVEVQKDNRDVVYKSCKIRRKHPVLYSSMIT